MIARERTVKKVNDTKYFSFFVNVWREEKNKKERKTIRRKYINNLEHI
jgi:hypothetical protein